MISAASPAFSGHLDAHPGGGRGAARGWRIAVLVAAEPCRPAAPPPQPRPLAAMLDALLSDGVPVRRPAALEARRGFGAGNGFLPGQIVDRSA